MEIVSFITQLKANTPTLNLRYTWAQDPIRFEDALGRVLPVPSEYDWKVCYCCSIACAIRAS